MYALWTRISPFDGKKLANKSYFNFFHCTNSNAAMAEMTEKI